MITFTTSDGREETNARLHPSCPDATLIIGKMLNGKQSIENLKFWIKSYKMKKWIENPNVF